MMKLEVFMKTILGFLKRAVSFLIAILCFIYAFGFNVNDILNPAKELGYLQTIQLITEGKVTKIQLNSDGETAKISLKENDIRYKTNIPNEEAFCELVQENISAKNNLEITKLSKMPFVLKAFLFICGFLNFRHVFSRKRKQKVKISKENNNNEEQEKSIDIRIGNSSLFETLNESLNDSIDFSQKFKKSNVHFSDVAVSDEVKEELTEIIDFLKKPDKYTSIGATIPKGILLSGHPGTGKTLLARAIAGEAGVAFLAISGPEFDDKYVGVGASRIRNLFKNAKNNAPCIIFIDEIDAVGQKRTSSEERWSSQTINQLLTEMDGFDSNSNIIVLAATNRPEILDPALVRPGRFDRTIEIGLPDVYGREKILQIHGKNKKFMDNVSFSHIALNTAGFSGADLSNLLNEAALLAARKNQQVITIQNIDEALRKVSIGLQYKGKKISEKERKLTAYHEAGHAIVAKFMSTQDRVKEISIVPRGTAGGYTWHEPTEDKNYTSKTELTERLRVLLGGRAAEQVALSDISTGASSDLRSATEIAKNMICVYGMNQEIGPISLVDTNSNLLGPDTMSLIGKIISQYVKDAEGDATQILVDNRDLLDIVAKVLLERETISGEEFNKIVEAYQKNKNVVNA